MSAPPVVPDWTSVGFETRSGGFEIQGLETGGVLGFLHKAKADGGSAQRKVIYAAGSALALIVLVSLLTGGDGGGGGGAAASAASPPQATPTIVPSGWEEGMAGGGDPAHQFAPERVAAIQQLKAELHLLTPTEQAARFDEIWSRYMLRSPPVRQTRIDHFVVLLMENRGADTIFGCMGLKGFDGVPAGRQ